MNFNFNFRSLFENIFSSNWRPSFGFSHSNKVSFGKGKTFSHGIRFNLGPKPVKKKISDLDLLMQDGGYSGSQPKRLLDSMTTPSFVKSDRNYIKSTKWYENE